MNDRLKTSSLVGEKLKELQSKTNFTPNILARLAVSFSLTKPEVPSPEIKTGPKSLEFNRTTLTGEYDYAYKALIAQHANEEISDEEFFPDLFNAHLERGIRLLENEYKHSGNAEKFMSNILEFKI